jgi:NADH-quinone oxidoreductase subunit J
VFEIQPLQLIQCLITCLSGGVGTYLMMPHRRQFAKPGLVFAIGLGLIIFAACHVMILGGTPSPIVSKIFFNIFAIASVVASALMITARDPVHSALWFAVVVLSTSGLFLLAGAGFLAAGTVIVYAGAIIVTFLFVIMLAQSEGKAVYDRLARQPAQATMTGFILIWCLLIVILSNPGNTYFQSGSNSAASLSSRLTPAKDLVNYKRMTINNPTYIVMGKTLTPEITLPDTIQATLPAGIPQPHVAGLGAAMYTTHLISSELVGAILFVALAGAVVIATPRMVGKSS